ncbi:GAF domain-containing sensor histidine kinase [Halobaculum sp. MBLA0147]|uniref:sensor histidine kinase n=1 Tax=Halobaculum sp. MBLA0147 TaxID=3079934 RepID=UPI0035233C77
MSDEPGRAEFFGDLYDLLNLREDDLDAKIDAAIDIGCDRLGVEHGVVTHTRDGAYEVLASSIREGEYAAGSVTDLSTTWCRHVVDDGETLAFDDVDRTPYADDVAREETGLVCYIGVPLVVEGETYGTLCFSDTESRGDEFTRADHEFVTLLAEWVSYEIESALHAEELVERNRRLDEFTGIVAHDLRNPLTAAIGYTELVSEQLEGQQRDHLEVVAENLHRMESMIDGLLLLAQQGHDVGERSPVRLDELAHAAWETIETRDATLVVETDRQVFADEARLRQVFENLFRNAVEHCPPGVSVTVRGTPDGFEVADDGPGLPAELAETLFDRDRIGDGERRGLGLLIVERIVRGHDWDVSVESGDDGTTFRVTGVQRGPETHPEGEASAS